VIPTVCRLRHNPFEIVCAGNSEEIAGAALDVINVQQPRRHQWYQPTKPAFALDEGPAAQVFTIDCQQVEGVKVRPISPE
jgi:hypothetical protein